MFSLQLFFRCDSDSSKLIFRSIDLRFFEENVQRWICQRKTVDQTKVISFIRILERFDCSFNFIQFFSDSYILRNHAKHWSEFANCCQKKTSKFVNN